MRTEGRRGYTMRPIFAVSVARQDTPAYRRLTSSAGLFSGLLCLLLSRLHSLQRSFDGNQAFAQNADSIEKTIEGVFVNRG